MQSEFIAYRGLVAAAIGSADAATVIVEAFEETAWFADARVVAELASAIMLLRNEDHAAVEETVRILHQALLRGQLDVVVTACRAYPGLARAGTTSRQTAALLTDALVRSRDFDLGRRVGLEMPRELRRNEELSPREREVYEHLIQGRSNREIARALFISQSTAKVHVRHILEKLGVHSRVEAARLAGRDFP
jgi:DNA-binding NarL/FixJ family response regulator